MRKKYRCLGGWVTSQGDGERHYIPARRLAELYKVDPEECLFMDEGDDWVKIGRGFVVNDFEGLVDLWPQDDGNYSLSRYVINLEPMTKQEVAVEVGKILAWCEDNHYAYELTEETVNIKIPLWKAVDSD